MRSTKKNINYTNDNQNRNICLRLFLNDFNSIGTRIVKLSMSAITALYNTNIVYFGDDIFFRASHLNSNYLALFTGTNIIHSSIHLIILYRKI